MASITPQLRTNTELFQREFETITHNLANANTAGFKRRGNSFVAALQSRLAGADQTGPIVPDTLSLEQQTDFSQGKLVHTGRSLDLALSGPGFFVVETPQGPQYTRNGVFHLDANGQLVDTEGHALAGESGPISLPPTVDLDKLEIAPDGRITSGAQVLGRLRLAVFPQDQHRLQAVGAGAFRAPAGLAPQTDENLTVHQGYQEASNVDTVKELVDMMSVSRLYEANMNFISARRDASKAMMQVAMG